MSPFEVFLYGIAISLSIFFISLPLLMIYNQLVTERRVQRAIDKVLENELDADVAMEKLDKAKAKVKK